MDVSSMDQPQLKHPPPKPKEKAKLMPILPPVMANKLRQWNCWGLRPNFDERSLLIQKHNPLAVCLQETFLKQTDLLTVRGFTIYNKYHENGSMASGGVSILVNENIPQSRIALNTNLQSVLVRVSAHKSLTLC